jgi:hypothetical protein
MEPFTLIVWITMGWRFQETRMLNLTREDCFTRLVAIEADRGRRVKAKCTAPGYREPRPEIHCAACGLLPQPGRLPSRRGYRLPHRAR